MSQARNEKTYSAVYAETSSALDFYAKALLERPHRAIVVAADLGGDEAVRAMFDALLDRGHRNVLVQALNSPNLPRQARDLLETLLYGNSRQTICALMRKRLH